MRSSGTGRIAVFVFQVGVDGQSLTADGDLGAASWDRQTDPRMPLIHCHSMVVGNHPFRDQSRPKCYLEMKMGYDLPYRVWEGSAKGAPLSDGNEKQKESGIPGFEPRPGDSGIKVL